MPIRTLQTRGRQIGEIRIGVQVDTGKTRRDGTKIFRPSKLDKFRLTTKSSNVAHAVAAAFGGTARQTVLANGTPTWEVMTDLDELPVMVPPGDAVISQWFELYTKAGCVRRCDGEVEQRTQKPCMCPSDPVERVALAGQGEACKPVSRLNVMLPDLPDLGNWKLASGGYYAATELGGAAAVLAAAREAGVIVPAVLRLEQREIRRISADDKAEVRKFAVPVLEIGASLRQLTELSAATSTIAGALPPPPSRALGAGPSRGQAGPDVLEGEVIDDQAGFANAFRLAEAASKATSQDEIVALGKAMQALGWADEIIDGEANLTLRQHLLDCHEELGRIA